MVSSKRQFILGAACALVLAGVACSQDKKSARTAKHKRQVEASFGMSTRAPTRKEVTELGLKWAVRAQGQIVTAVSKDSAMAKAGIQKGDVVLKLDQNEIFSQDDIADFLRVSEPGQRVKVQVQRAKGDKKETLSVALGTKKVRKSKTPTLKWEFASLGQLEFALARAKKKQRLVLVGLSGAET